MTRWLRWIDPNDPTLTGYVEVDDDGAALRHLEVRGPQRRPVAAVTLDDLLPLRDQEAWEDMRAYGERYGHGSVLEGRVWNDLEPPDAVVEISAAEFDEVWRPARAELDARP